MGTVSISTTSRLCPMEISCCRVIPTYLHGNPSAAAASAVNPGSVSIPKAGSRHSYMILEGRQASWKELAGDIYHTEML